MTSQTVAKIETDTKSQQAATVLAMDAFKPPHQARLTAPAKAANQDEDLDDFWDNVPV